MERGQSEDAAVLKRGCTGRAVMIVKRPARKRVFSEGTLTESTACGTAERCNSLRSLFEAQAREKRCDSLVLRCGCAV